MERFGLFTIIILGEVVVAVVRGVAGHHHLDWEVGVTAALGMLIAIALWWVYFDSVSHHKPRPGRLTVSGWMYLHLPMTMGIGAAGAAVVNVVEHAGEPLPAEVRWLLVGAIAVVLVSIALLTRTIQASDEVRAVNRSARRVLLLSCFVIVLLGFTNLGTVPLLLAPVFYGFKMWPQFQEPEASDPTQDRNSLDD